MNKLTEFQSNKIKGIFYGQAIGDALGLGTEFLTKSQIISDYYPNGLMDYAQIIQDSHRKSWDVGDWTDDTDQFLCICESILQDNCVNELTFANKLFQWFKSSPMGIGQTVLKVVSLPQFTTYPYKASEFIWKMNKKQVASNGAIMRTSILGTYEYWDYYKVVENTERIAKVTHWDSRCVGSCVLVTTIISTILSQDKLLDLHELMEIADSYDNRMKPYLEEHLTEEISDLKLDEQVSMGYTLKALSAGLWVYFHAESFESGLLKIINEGGDSDTNGCVAGSILGAKFGYNSIPKQLVEGLKNKTLLDEQFNAYVEKLKEKYMTYELTINV